MVSACLLLGLIYVKAAVGFFFYILDNTNNNNND